MKECLAFFGCLSLRGSKRVITVEVVQITLYIYLAASGTAVAEPSTVETPTAPPRNERAEASNGGLQCLEFGVEKGIDVVRPLIDIRVNRTEFEQNDGTKRDASYCATPTIFTRQREAMSSKGDKNSGNSSYQCDGYCGLYLSLPL